jgi:hypothetical protein
MLCTHPEWNDAVLGTCDDKTEWIQDDATPAFFWYINASTVPASCCYMLQTASIASLYTYFSRGWCVCVRSAGRLSRQITQRNNCKKWPTLVITTLHETYAANVATTKAPCVCAFLCVHRVVYLCVSVCANVCYVCVSVCVLFVLNLSLFSTFPGTAHRWQPCSLLSSLTYFLALNLFPVLVGAC